MDRNCHLMYYYIAIIKLLISLSNEKKIPYRATYIDLDADLFQQLSAELFFQQLLFLR